MRHAKIMIIIRKIARHLKIANRKTEFGVDRVEIKNDTFLFTDIEVLKIICGICGDLR
jgi:hypothetical protein